MTNTTPVEERLATALRARADQVTHDDLTTLVVPRGRRSRRAGLTAAALVAAVVAAVVGLPLVGGDPTDDRPAPPVTTPTPGDLGEVRVDLDGDGVDDRARIEADVLEVEVSSGSGAGVAVPAGSRLLPAVTDAGTRHPLVVAVPPAGNDSAATTVTYRGGILTVGEAPASLVQRPGSPVWVDDIGALMIGEFDPGVPEDQRVLVAATAYRATRDGTLVEHGAGDLCWDRATHAYPVPCDQLPAQDADPSLMFPMMEGGVGVGEVSPVFDGRYERAELVRGSGGAVELVLTWDGIEHRALVGEGGGWTLEGTVVGGVEMPAFLVSQRTGENTSYAVVARYDGELQSIPTADEGGWLGTGFIDDSGQVYQRTWLSRTNVLWTARRLSPDEPNRYDLVRWSDELGPTLVPMDQGEVCLDLDAGRKLPDAACRG